MSKFDFLQMGYDDGSCMCYNKEKHSKEMALASAGFELDLIDEPWDDDIDRLEVFTSFIQYGFFSLYPLYPGQVFNGWNIDNIFEPVQRRNKNQVEVWVVREVD